MPELVVNGSAGEGIAGWTAASAAGPVQLTHTGQTIKVRRADGSGAWAYALATLHSPGIRLKVGRAYRMQAWIRETSGTGAPAGMLLANGEFAHRPTEVSQYAGYRDRGWHLMSRTFICVRRAHTDTALYFGLPSDGAFTVQLKGVSLREVDVPLPPAATGAPTRTIAFDGPRGSPPDPAVWRHDTGGHGWGNEELQTYTSRPSNAQLDGAGHLVITARAERLRGTDGISREFTSARIAGRDQLAIAPGSYIEAPIKAPVGDGIWPAFWTVGNNIDSAGWPASGELDIFEGWGASPTIAHSAIHLSARTDPHAHHQYGWTEPGGSTDLGETVDVRPHRYGVYFDGRLVRFYIDRRPTMTVWADDAIKAGYAWPFARPQRLLLNVAVPPGVHAGFPKMMTVGTISVWAGGVPPVVRPE